MKAGDKSRRILTDNLYPHSLPPRRLCVRFVQAGLLVYLTFTCLPFPENRKSGFSIVKAFIPNYRDQDYSGGATPDSHGIPL
jgi:hypothetical protein